MLNMTFITFNVSINMPTSSSCFLPEMLASHSPVTHTLRFSCEMKNVKKTLGNGTFFVSVFNVSPLCQEKTNQLGVTSRTGQSQRCIMIALCLRINIQRRLVQVALLKTEKNTNIKTTQAQLQ